METEQTHRENCSNEDAQQHDVQIRLQEADSKQDRLKRGQDESDCLRRRMEAMTKHRHSDHLNKQDGDHEKAVRWVQK